MEEACGGCSFEPLVCAIRRSYSPPVRTGRKGIARVVAGLTAEGHAPPLSLLFRLCRRLPFFLVCSPYCFVYLLFFIFMFCILLFFILLFFILLFFLYFCFLYYCFLYYCFLYYCFLYYCFFRFLICIYFFIFFIFVYYGSVYYCLINCCFLFFVYYSIQCCIGMFFIELSFILYCCFVWYITERSNAGSINTTSNSASNNQ